MVYSAQDCRFECEKKMAATKQCSRKMSPVPISGIPRRAPKLSEIRRQNTINEEEDILSSLSLGQDSQLNTSLGQDILSSLSLGQDSQLNHTTSNIHNEDMNNVGMGGKDDTNSILWDYSAENIKNAMCSRTSFISVIAQTKDLSLSDEKKRSPTHSPIYPTAFNPTPTSANPPVTSNPPIHSANTPTSTPPLSRTLTPPPIPPRIQPGPPRVPPIGLHASVEPLVNNTGSVPVPAKCSSQLRKLIQTHSIVEEDKDNDCLDGVRPIYPNLPYSPYSSPCSSPRIKRKPLVETRTVSTEHNGDFVQLNQYKLQGVVGQGSYGIVKLAYNEEDDTNYAMKILSKKKLKKKAGIFGRAAPNRKGSGGTKIKTAENPLDKVYREIAIMKKLDHPNVVKLVEVLDDPEDDQLYMVFEMLERGEVLEVPTAEPLGEQGAWSSFRDVLLGLEYLHYQKIIHRDIKPSNLLRADSGEVKIADLGVSNEFDGNDAFLTSTVGTPAFTPPECLSQQPGEPPYSGKAADIWSLGVTLYSLVYGRVPFFDNNIVALYNIIKTKHVEIPPGSISAELEDLLTRMLRKDPNQRISLLEIKEHDWVTGCGVFPMLKEDENCVLVEVTDIEVQNSVRSIPKLDTLILVKAMLKQHSFSNPFHNIKEKFRKRGRSNSAPGDVHIYLDSHTHTVRLPSLTESGEDSDSACVTGSD